MNTSYRNPFWSALILARRGTGRARGRRQPDRKRIESREYLATQEELRIYPRRDGLDRSRVATDAEVETVFENFALHEACLFEAAPRRSRPNRDPASVAGVAAQIVRRSHKDTIDRARFDAQAQKQALSVVYDKFS